MPESLGARLRQRREERQVALTTIAEQTKIKLSLLDALERDDVSRWPTGIFRRAYVRAYAHAIGLDPDVVVREFLALHPDPDESIDTLSVTLARAQAGRAPAARFRTIVDSAIGSLAGLRHGPAVESSSVVAELATDGPTRTDPAPAAAVEAPAQPATGAVTDDVGGEHAEPPAPRAPDPDLLAVARLCTELGRVEHAHDVPPLLQEAARLLDATGLVLWVWDARTATLRAALAHGYSARVLAQLPAVTCDADNATAAAYRSRQTCVINGTAATSGALAVPLLTPAGCAGVLALELRHGGERAPSVLALATMLAALLAQLTGGAPSAEARHHEMRRASGEGG